MGNPSFRLARLAAGALLALAATAGHAQVYSLDDGQFTQPLGTYWYTGGTAATLGSLAGDNYVDLDNAEYIYQSFTVDAGGWYTLSFKAFGTGLAEIFNSSDVGLNNFSSPVADVTSAPGTWGTPPTPGWQNVTLSFMAAEHASYHLYFSGYGANGAWVDNVSVAAAVPEPETMAMMLAGLGALGMMSRRRRLGGKA